MTASSSTPVLDQLRAVPDGFGQPTFASLLTAILADVRAQAAAGAPPPTLLVMGEPLAGKSTFLSQLFVRLIGSAGEALIPDFPPSPPAPLPPGERGVLAPACSPSPAHRERGLGGEGSSVRPYLVRWGDTIRGAKKAGRVAQERQFGDLTPDEFTATSELLTEAAQAAGRAAQGGAPALVVVEAPGVTMFTGADSQLRGLNRGYTLARRLASDDHGYLIALCADQRVREAHLGARQERITGGGPEIREATQLAANRIRQQVTDLLFALSASGAISLPEPAPASPLTRESLDRHPAYRNDAVLRAYLPHLLRDDLGVPPARAFVGLNGFLGEDVRPDAQLLDAYDWTHEHFGI